MLVEAGELGANLTGGHRGKAFQTAKKREPREILNRYQGTDH